MVEALERRLAATAWLHRLILVADQVVVAIKTM